MTSEKLAGIQYYIGFFSKNTPFTNSQDVFLSCFSGVFHREK